MRDKYSLITHGIKACIEKLDEKDFKPDFVECTIEEAIEGVVHETGEAIAEILKSPRDYEALRKEAADISNFGFIIILLCDYELAKGETKMYDVINLVGDKAYTVLSNVSLGLAKMYVRESAFVCEIVPHIEKVPNDKTEA